MPAPAETRPVVAGGTRATPVVLLSLAAIFLVLRVVTGMLEHPTPIADGEFVTWRPIAGAEAEAAKNGKPILYDFTADWCPPCRAMKQDVFRDVVTGRRVNQLYVPVRVLDRAREEGQNSAEVSELQARYHIDAFPTLVVVRPGAEPQVLSGYPGQEGTRTWLEHSATIGRR